MTEAEIPTLRARTPHRAHDADRRVVGGWTVFGNQIENDLFSEAAG